MGTGELGELGMRRNGTLEVVKPDQALAAYGTLVRITDCFAA
jgi:hypothetical protein